MNAMPLLSLLCFRTVWPDWAIFKFVGHKFYLKSSPNFSWLFGSFEKHQFLCKTCYILGNVFNNLDSLYSNIWSHCSTVNVNKLYDDDKFCTFFAALQIFLYLQSLTLWHKLNLEHFSNWNPSALRRLCNLSPVSGDIKELIFQRNKVFLWRSLFFWETATTLAFLVCGRF